MEFRNIPVFREGGRYSPDVAAVVGRADVVEVDDKIEIKIEVPSSSVLYDFLKQGELRALSIGADSILVDRGYIVLEDPVSS